MFVNPFEDHRGLPRDTERAMTLRVCPSCQVGHTGSRCWLCDGPTVERKFVTPQGHVWQATVQDRHPHVDDPGHEQASAAEPAEAG